ncbi:MAG: cytochrome c3 family protein [Planctomycetota bacterium]
MGKVISCGAVCHDQSSHQSHPDPQVLLNDPDGGSSILFDGSGASILGFCRCCHDANGQGGNLSPFTSGRIAADIDAWWSKNPSHARSPVGVTCWSCHAGTTKGPHGSDNPWILKLAYKTADNTSESAQAYALCYSCHSRDSILGNASFKEHSKHIVGEKAPCSTCHDAHGSRIHSGNLSGTHLINFRTDIVHANSSNDLYFRDDGGFKGACSLTCHGKGHTNKSY